MGKISTQTRQIELVIQQSNSLAHWPVEEQSQYTSANKIKLSIQDHNEFPNLKTDTIELDVGYRHWILVSFVEMGK